MFVGALKIEILIPGSNNLKDKRKIVKSLKDKIRYNYNVSVAEIDYQEKWQRATIGFSVVNERRGEIEILIEKIKKTIEENFEVIILNTDQYIFPVGDYRDGENI